MVKQTSSNIQENQILSLLDKLESRLSRIEAHLHLEPLPNTGKSYGKSEATGDSLKSTDRLELAIGEFWFARVGIIILALGIAFVLTFPYNNLPPVMPSLAGYFFVLTIFGLSHYWRENFVYISRYLFGGALILLYFSTLRLYFFSQHPVLTNKSWELILLLTVVIITLIIAVYKKSPYLAGLGLMAGYLTALVGGTAYFLFFVVTFLAGSSVYLKFRYDWPNVLIFSCVLAYITHFLWFINNPVLAHTLELVSSPEINLIFIIVYSVIFTTGIIFRRENLSEDTGVRINALINSLGCYGLYFFISGTKFSGHFGILHILISLIFLLIAIGFWLREKSRYSTFFYSIAGYLALSFAIISRFEIPQVFVWLSWQSILVISTAIWFRSKYIVVANFFILAIIFFTYLASAGQSASAGLNIGIVALVSARIMNWQKDRLELRTELMRNAYLIVAFLIVPYALYFLVPGGYISLSWIAVTLVYYGLSLLLHNKKYRWMALGTLLLTISYLLIIGITKLEPVYRIITFLVLGMVLIGISLHYTRMRAKGAHNN